MPHCPRCGELLYNLNGDKITCYACGSEIEKDEKLEKFLTQKEGKNEVD